MARGTKSFSPEAKAAIQAVIREVVARDFEGNIKAAAKQMGISYAQLWGIHDGAAGAGNKTLEKIADYTGKSLDELTGRRPAGSAGDGAVTRAREPGSRPVYRNLENWDGAVAQALKRWPWLRRYPPVVDAAGDTSALFLAGPATPELVRDAVQHLLDNGDPDLIEAAEAARVDAQIGETEARYAKALLIQKEMRERGEDPPHVRILMQQVARDEKRAARGLARTRPANEGAPPAKKSGKKRG